MRFFTAFIATSASLLFGTAAFAETNMVVILDMSNSMWGQVEGKAKIETARSAVGDLLKDIPAGTKLGLLAYGHTSKESCTDVGTLLPLGDVNADKVTKLKKAIGELKPMGKTPIAYSLEQGGKAFSDPQGNNQLVLISDGIESCDGDPCAVAEKLAKNNVKTKVHVVGFDVDAPARKQLECIAEKGGGKYFNAKSVRELNQAMADVKKATVEESKPEPKATVAFEDRFDGANLAQHWTVLNPAPDNFIVDGGKLMLVSKNPSDLTKADMPNLMQWAGPLPEGDWELEVGMTMEANTAWDRFYIGFYDDANNWLAGGLRSANGGAGGYSMYLFAEKNSEGQITKTEKPLLEFPCNVCADEWTWSAFNDKLFKGRPVVIKIRKQGVNYTVSGTLGKEEETGTKKEERKFQSVALDGIKQLRPRKSLVLGVAHTNNNIGKNPEGEAVVHIDYVKLNTFGDGKTEAPKSP